ncbi:MAG: hypothetical protein J5506_08950 [Prevotella sp.]|nr:hypothetical protein [Prevotella sp.]
MIKQTFLLLLSLTLSATALADDSYDYLVFRLQDGTLQSVNAVGTTITFDGTNAVVTNGSNRLTLPVANLASMFFSNDASATAIKSIDSDDSSDEAEYYTLGGVKVDRMEQGGVYIIRKNGKTYKQVVK